MWTFLSIHSVYASVTSTVLTYTRKEREIIKEQSQSWCFMSTSTTGWLVVLLLHRNHHEMLDWFQMLLVMLLGTQDCWFSFLFTFNTSTTWEATSLFFPTVHFLKKIKMVRSYSLIRKDRVGWGKKRRRDRLMHTKTQFTRCFFDFYQIPLDNSGGSGTEIGWLEYT